MQPPYLLPVEEPDSLSETLETLLHGYLAFSFQQGTHWQEALSHYEVTRQLIAHLNRVDHGDTATQSAA